MTDETTCSADVLIIGSGVGGLSAGIILSKLGYGVIIVERNPLPGGLMRSYRKRGIDCPVGIHYLGAFGEGQPMRRMFDYLGVSDGIPLERMGVGGVIDRYVFDDFSFDLPEGIDLFEDRLRQAFPGDQDTITAVMGRMRTIARQFSALDFLYAPFNPISLMGSLDSLGDFLNSQGCSPGLRGVLSVPPTWIGLSLDECPILYHHMALVSYLLSSWRLQGSGAQMADVLADRFRELGGSILCDDAVEGLLLRDGAVCGARLHSGKILNAPRIVAAVHPKVLLDLMPEGALKPSYRRRVSEIEDTHGVFSAIYMVDDRSLPELPYNVFGIHSNKCGAIPEGAFYQVRKSGKIGFSALTIIQPDWIDAWRNWEATLSGKRGAAYLDAKRLKADRLLEEASNLIGPFESAKILDTYTPLTLRDWVHSPGGSAYGILRSTRQLLKAASISRPAVNGLFYAGQNALVPGIAGTVFASFHMVKQMIGEEKFLRDVVL